MSISMLIGVALALLFTSALHVLWKERSESIWRAGLIIAAFVYVGFALWSREPIVIDLLGVALYGLFAWLSTKYGLIWLAIGWALHIAWDVIIHFESTHVPEWYPALCFGFDAAVALYIIFLIRMKDEKGLSVSS